MLEIEIGKSFEENLSRAVKVAAGDLLRKMMIEPQLTFLFSSGFDEEKGILEVAKEMLPNTVLLGGKFISQSLGKEIFSKGISIIGMRFQKVSFEIEGGEIKGNEESFAKKVAKELSQKFKNPKFLIIFATNTLQNLEGMVSEIQEVFGQDFPMLGIVSGSNLSQKEAPLYFNQEVIKNGILLVGFEGEIFFDCGTVFGFEPIGLAFEATSSDGKILSQIDQKKALSLYQEYFGPKANLLKEKMISSLSTNYPLAVQIKEENFLLRNVISAKNGELILLGQIPQKSKIYFTIGDEKKAQEKTKETAFEILKKMSPKEIRVVFLFASALRQKFLGLEALNEIKEIQNIFGSSSQIIYLSGFGEIGPLPGFGKGNQCFFHNSSLVILAIG